MPDTYLNFRLDINSMMVIITEDARLFDLISRLFRTITWDVADLSI